MCLEDTVRIPLRARDGSVRAYALVDAADAEIVNRHRWSLHKPHGRVNRVTTVNKKQVAIFLHRFLLGLGPGDPRQGDHINRNPLDNRRKNLRIATNSQNSQNTSPRVGSSAYRGVCWHKASQRWRANAYVYGKTEYLGEFTSETDAAEAARAARARLMPFAID